MIGEVGGGNTMKSLKIILLASVCIQFGIAQEIGTKISTNGETILSKNFGKTKVVAKFLTSIIEIKPLKNENDKRHFVQCTYSRIPCSLTENISVEIDGKLVIVPINAYSDLGDINEAHWSINKGNLMLIITGGDASESFIAKLIFNKRRLTERRLYSGEDQYRPLEISYYYQVVFE